MSSSKKENTEFKSDFCVLQELLTCFGKVKIDLYDTSQPREKRGGNNSIQGFFLLMKFIIKINPWWVIGTSNNAVYVSIEIRQDVFL